MERCPVCRAALGGALECRRCRADLHKLSEVEAEARALAGRAMLLCVRGDGGEASRLLDRARLLHDAPELEHLALALRFEGQSPAGERSDPLPPSGEEESPRPEEPGAGFDRTDL